jgi:hypothetical protein
MSNPPKVFISYAWENDDHKEWVVQLASRLRSDGVESIIDQWELVPGDQLPYFMERAVKESAFVLIICTPKYKHRSDQREGGVGYEGDIMTAEVSVMQNRRKFIPVLRGPTWKDAAPIWLLGSKYICMWDEALEDEYRHLLNILKGKVVMPPPIVRDTNKFP